MNIVVATGLYPPEIGGPATYARMVEEELPKHDIAVTVLPFGRVRSYPKVIRHIVYTIKLWRAAAAAEVIYALDPISVGWPALLVAKLRRRRLLVRLGGDYAWEQGCARFGLTRTLDEYTKRQSGRPLPVRVLAWLQTAMVRRAERVIVPSEYLKRIVASWGVPAEQVTVIYSVLFPLSVDPDRETLREELQFTFPTIVSAGRLVPWKGFAALIRVIDRLRGQYPEIQLVIAGDGAERAQLEAQIQSAGLSEHVRLLGNVGKDALGATIKAADVFVLNTAYEGLSHQLLEVMDLGTPVVTTDVGGNPELIEHGVTGLLVEPDDENALAQSITTFLSDAHCRHELTTAAKARVHFFTKQQSILQLEAILHETE